MNSTLYKKRLSAVRSRSGKSEFALALTLALALLTMTTPAQAQTYTYGLLHSFTGTPDGADPSTCNNCTPTGSAGLALDLVGNLYGTTSLGGAYGAGTVFEVNTSGSETVLYNFCSQPRCIDGTTPGAALVLDGQGNLYGTTQFGGTHQYAGTIFKLNMNGAIEVLYDFCSQAGCVDGGSPSAGSLFLDAQNNLYGATSAGGMNGQGTVFELSSTGAYTVLYSATDDQPQPMAGLTMDAEGNLYGTSGGGSDNRGIVFKLDTSGRKTELYSFCSQTHCPDGSNPNPGVVIDGQGNLYGLTSLGGLESPGAPYGFGVVFKIDASGNETSFYKFQGTLNEDGWHPYSGLSIDAQGNLYGTTYHGGTAGSGLGTVFKIDPSGNETLLYSFSAKTPGMGDRPTAGVALDPQGNIYGVSQGGNDKDGTVFVLLTAAAATTTTLTSNPNPSISGQAVSFTAAVSGRTGVPPNGETVSFMKGKTVLGTATLSSGLATLSDSALSNGTTSIRAVYGGDPLFAGSTSNTVKQVVKK